MSAASASEPGSSTTRSARRSSGPSRQPPDHGHGRWPACRVGTAAHLDHPGRSPAARRPPRQPLLRRRAGSIRATTRIVMQGRPRSSPTLTSTTTWSRCATRPTCRPDTGRPSRRSRPSTASRPPPLVYAIGPAGENLVRFAATTATTATWPLLASRAEQPSERPRGRSRRGWPRSAPGSRPRGDGVDREAVAGEAGARPRAPAGSPSVLPARWAASRTSTRRR